MEVEAEIRLGRDGFHGGAIDGTLGLEREGYVRIRAELAVAHGN